jgi:hypothetical protein
MYELYVQESHLGVVLGLGDVRAVMYGQRYTSVIDDSQFKVDNNIETTTTTTPDYPT